MNLFHVIDDGAVILRAKRGVYRQSKVYRRGKDVFASFGSGFVRLMARTCTTNPDVSWLEIEAPGVVISNSGHPQFHEASPS